ncbi:MAG: carbohydrate kinase family protein [Candidatus Hodarchaeales archaeon]
MSEQKIFSMGHISVDVIIKRTNIDKLKVGGCITTDDLSLSTGGDVANVSYWVGNLGHSIEFIGVVGKDEAANFLKRDLEEAGVKLNLKYSENNPSSIILILVEDDGERSHIINGKSQEEVEWEDLPLKELEKCTLFYTSGYTIEKTPIKETVKRLFRHLKGLNNNEPKIMFNFAAYTTVEREITEIENNILPYVDILVGNFEEYSSLMKGLTIETIDDFRRMSTNLFQKYENLEILLVTMGKKGCYFQTGKTYGHVKAPEVKVSDTTGAGDGFCAGFISGYISGLPIDKCVEKGVKLGSAICEGFGARFGGVKTLQRIFGYE